MHTGNKVLVFIIFIFMSILKANANPENFDYVSDQVEVEYTNMVEIYDEINHVIAKNDLYQVRSYEENMYILKNFVSIFHDSERVRRSHKLLIPFNLLMDINTSLLTTIHLSFHKQQNVEENLNSLVNNLHLFLEYKLKLMDVYQLSGMKSLVKRYLFFNNIVIGEANPLKKVFAMSGGFFTAIFSVPSSMLFGGSVYMYHKKCSDLENAIRKNLQYLKSASH